MSSKKVTIVIPTYNGEKYIEETIESCLEQSYSNISIVVVNDNSTDRTLEVVKKFENKIQIIHNNLNQGLPKNINKVILNDDSDFFIYLGHDDVLPPKHVEIMLEEFDEDTVAVHCNSMAIDNDGKKLDYTRDNKIQQQKTEDIMYQLSLDNFISVIGMMNRTSAFKSISGWEPSYNLYGEWFYYIRLANIGRIKYTTKTFAYYRIHDTNISKTLHDKDKLKAYYIYKKRCRLLANEYSKNLKILKNVNFYFQYFLNYLRYLKALMKSK